MEKDKILLSPVGVNDVVSAEFMIPSREGSKLTSREDKPSEERWQGVEFCTEVHELV